MYFDLTSSSSKSPNAKVGKDAFERGLTEMDQCFMKDKRKGSYVTKSARKEIENKWEKEFLNPSSVTRSAKENNRPNNEVKYTEQIGNDKTYELHSFLPLTDCQFL